MTHRAKLEQGLNLESEFEAVQELSKGKRTTDPLHHTGEGIFFTSKVVDLFRLVSSGVRWTVDNLRQDQALGTFVSRSEARRLLDGLEDDFEIVEVDFAGVTDVGQGFIDELLRVWPTTHPGTTVIPINMNPAVEFMVRRGRRG
jgi:hypothetical protein